MKRKAIILVSFLSCAFVNAQTWTDAEMLERQNYGLKLGLNFTSMWGGELQNPWPYFGPTAGFFWHTKETKKPFMFQTGFEGSLRGSNFANKSTDFPGGGNTNYRRIGLITADVPILLNYRLGPKKENRTRVIQAGAMVSATMRSTVYLGEDKLPAQHFLDSTSHLYQWDNLPLKPIEFLAVIGYQDRGISAGWQVQLQVGINNLNDVKIKNGNIIPFMPYAYPATNTGKRISTWNLKFSALF
ncbi:MAG: hypothetical protein FJ347_04305 [Sphingomonadales bacterium]|nr:hypothetical protein [Sphingomonadales bacterium]